MSGWGNWLRVITLFMILFAGFYLADRNRLPGAPPAVPASPPVSSDWGLKLQPCKVRFKNVLPGTQKGMVRLVNNGPHTVRDITLYPSCGCVHLNVPHINQIAPGKSVVIPFTMGVYTAGYFEEMITAYVGADRRVAAARVELWASAIPPFVGLKGLKIAVPTFTRFSPSRSSQPQIIRLITAPPISALKLIPTEGWMHI